MKMRGKRRRGYGRQLARINRELKRLVREMNRAARVIARTAPAFIALGNAANAATTNPSRKEATQ